MATERLGLFDTPPGRQEVRLGLIVVGLFVAALLVIFPMRERALGEVFAFVPLVDAFMFFSDLIIATLLFAQAGVFRSRALTVLASGYLFTGLVVVPHALTFPNAFAEPGMLGAGVNSAAWLSVFRRLTFPIAVICYALLKPADLGISSVGERPHPRVLEGVIAAFAFSVVATLLATVGHDLLPPIFRNSRDTVQVSLVVINALTILLSTAAITLLMRQQRSVLDLWLLVAVSVWLIQSLLNVTLKTRYTVGWYGLNGMTLTASLVVMIALIAETHRLFARLALHTAARERERDARLMAMDAVAAAIAQEIGQPVAAARLSAAAGLEWLDRSAPDPKMAIKSMQGSIDAGDKIFDVIKGIRATISNGSSSLSEFSLNELVRETVGSMHNDLAAGRIAVRMDLDEALPPILANRVQLGRVLVNLITNAIEAVGERRKRSIEIRTSVDGDQLLLAVADNGVGIADDKLTQIFDPFVTTKRGRIGLGLSLSRTIVEENGGRLWAAAGTKHGATLILKLPMRVSSKHKTDTSSVRTFP